MVNRDVPDEMLDEEELGTELEPGREPPPFTQAPDWVALADISPTARHLHTVLSAHINQRRAGQRVVWPSTRSLAKILNLSRRDKVSPFIAELVKLGAIDKARRGMPARNVYVIHQMPPQGYTGPLSVSEWYERHRDELAAEAAADDTARAAKKEAKRAAAAAKKVSGESGDNVQAEQVGTQVTPVTPDSGQQGEEPPVTPDAGQLVAPPDGQPVTPPGGREQYEVEQEQLEQEQAQDQKPPADADGGAARSKIAQQTIDGGEEPLDAEKIADPKDVAKGIARVWLGYWADPKRNTPIGGAAPHVLHARMTSCVLGFLTREYTREEIGKALNLIAEPIIPTPDRLQRALREVREGRPTPRQSRNGRRSGADVENDWADVRPAEGTKQMAAASTGGAEW